MSTVLQKQSLTYRLLNNSAAFMGGHFVTRTLKFLAALMIIRLLSREEYGQFSFIYVYLNFFEIFVQFGSNSILVREVVQNKDNAPRILGNALIFRFFLCLVALPIPYFLTRILNYPISVQQGVLLASFQIFLTLRSVFEVIYKIQLKLLYSEIWNAMRIVFTLMLVGVAVVFHPTLMAFIAAYLVSGVIGFIGFVVYTRRYIKLDFQFDPVLFKNLIRQSLPLLFSGYLTAFYYRIDVFMLSKMKGFLDVASYSVATRLTEALGLVASALFVSIFPVLSQSFKENRAQFESVILKSFQGLLLVGLPLFLGGVLVAKELTVFLFGAQYESSSLTVAILLAYTFFFYLGGLLVNIVIACGKQVVDAWISLFLLLMNVGFNLWLIPKYSYNGAAVTTVIVEITGVVLLTIYALRHHEIRMPWPSKAWRIALCINTPYFFFLYLLKVIFHAPLGIYLFIGVLTYGLLMLGFRIVTWKQVMGYFGQWKEDRNDGIESNTVKT